MPTFSQLISISPNNEAIPYLATRTGYLYVNLNYGGDPNKIGYIRKYNLSNLTYTDLYSGSGYAMWQGVYLRHKNLFVRVGEFKDSSDTFRAGIAVHDLSSDAVSTYYRSDTGDANELIGVVYDYKNRRIIAGERGQGGSPIGSSYPNGGGLWVIPEESLNNPSAWSRVYQFDAIVRGGIVPEVRTLAILGDYIFAEIFDGTNARIMRASLSNLTSWSVVDDPGIDSGVYSYRDMVYYMKKGTNGNLLVVYSRDGSTWSTIDTGIALSSLTDASVPFTVSTAHGKYIFIVVQKSTGASVVLVNFDDGTASVVGNIANQIGPHQAGVALDDTVFLGGAFGTGGYIYQYKFDSKRVLTLTVPSSASPGSQITLTAKLTDGVNPISGATVEFWVVNSLVDGKFDGTLIGTATTDANGNASVRYTIPSTATGFMIFRAEYRG